MLLRGTTPCAGSVVRGPLQPLARCQDPLGTLACVWRRRGISHSEHAMTRSFSELLRLKKTQAPQSPQPIDHYWYIRKIGIRAQSSATTQGDLITDGSASGDSGGGLIGNLPFA